MNRLDIIQHFIDKYDLQSYLEIGVDTGYVFGGVRINHKESVDPAENEYSHATPTYKMTSDEFFMNYPEKRYDIIFIDGLHESEQVTKDIQNSVNSLNPNGVIILHDCNPTTEQIQIVPRIQSLWSGNVWKSFVKFSYENKDKFNCYVIDTDYGCGVIESGITNIQYIMPDNLTYNWLEANRQVALNLVTVDTFQQK